MTLKIPVNKKRFPISFVISLLTTVFFLSAVSSISKEEVFGGMIHYIVYGIPALISSLYTYILLVNYLRALFDESAELVVSDLGITDNLTVFSCGRISWDEIVDIKTSSHFNIRLLLVKVKNPKSVIKRQAFWKRYFLYGFNRKWETPVIISERIIDYDFFELERILKRNIP